MSHAWIAAITAAALVATGIGCIIRGAYFSRTADQAWGIVVGGAVLVVFGLAAAAAASVLYLFATTHFS